MSSPVRLTELSYCLDSVNCSPRVWTPPTQQQFVLSFVLLICSPLNSNQLNVTHILVGECFVGHLLTSGAKEGSVRPVLHSCFNETLCTSCKLCQIKTKNGVEKLTAAFGVFVCFDFLAGFDDYKLVSAPIYKRYDLSSNSLLYLTAGKSDVHNLRSFLSS